MEIQELANIMYDDHGPAKIGLQLLIQMDEIDAMLKTI